MAEFLDSDSDFGYDLSAEDEQTLLQLTSSTLVTSTLNAAIDSVPERTDTISTRTAAATRRGDDTPHENDAEAVFAQTTSHSPTRPMSLPSPELLDGDVTYPDCRQTDHTLSMFASCPIR